MAFSFCTIDGQKLFVVDAAELTNMSEFSLGCENAVQAVSTGQANAALMDLSQTRLMTDDITSLRLRDLAVRLALLTQTRPTNIRVAILASDDHTFGMARLFATHASHLESLDVLVTRSRDEAVFWLSEQNIARPAEAPLPHQRLG